MRSPSPTTRGRGLPVVLLHGLTAARRYVVMGSQRAAAGRASRRRLRRARPRRRRRRRTPPTPTATARSTGDLARVLDELRDRARRAGRRVDGRAHVPALRARAARARGGRSSRSRPGFDPGRSTTSPQRLARWDALSDALRDGRDRGLRRGVRRAADPRAVARRAWRARCASGWRSTSTWTRSPTRCAGCRARRRSPTCTRWSRSSARRSSIGSRDEADPGHPLEIAELYAELLPAGRLVVEDEGASPLAWQGGRVSKLIAEMAERAE